MTPVNALDALDADELFMLGLQASTANDAGQAIGYFKLALSRSPDHARAHWALAAEYAGLKMMDRAEVHFARAVELDDQHPVARFQYGLLLLTSGRLGEAEATWAPLDALDEAHPVRLFKSGLLHMARDEFDAALVNLRQAMSDPALEPALARDVKMAIDQIEAARAANPPAVDAAVAPAGDPAPAPAPAAESVESHLAFSAYRGATDASH